MIQGIANIIFKVSDVQRASDFYEKTLGLSIAYKENGADWVEIDLNGVHLGLTKGEPTGGASNPAVTLLVDDLSGTVAQLKERGVNFIGDIRSEAYGQMITAADPDGNQFDLFEPSDE